MLIQPRFLLSFLGVNAILLIGGIFLLHWDGEALWVYIAVLLGLSLLSLWVARSLASTLVNPIKQLAEAAGKLASGHYETRVEVNQDDELGQLSEDFNQLATTLAANERARQQWIADISHELRTPLSVLRGEVEAMQDGVRKVDEASLHSLHQEIMQLSRLVNDLYELSMSDIGALSYRKHRVDMHELIEQTAEHFAEQLEQHYLKLRLELLPQEVWLWADAQRLQQLFYNLFSNSLRYTDKGGKIQIKTSLDETKNTLLIDFMDSSPGVSEQELPHLFNRLYRVEGSRNRATGGAGLGLAISQNIVTAHQGEIQAQASPLGGLWLRIQLPLESEGN